MRCILFFLCIFLSSPVFAQGFSDAASSGNSSSSVVSNGASPLSCSFLQMLCENASTSCVTETAQCLNLLNQIIAALESLMQLQEQAETCETDPELNCDEIAELIRLLQIQINQLYILQQSECEEAERVCRAQTAVCALRDQVCGSLA